MRLYNFSYCRWGNVFVKAVAFIGDQNKVTSAVIFELVLHLLKVMDQVGLMLDAMAAQDCIKLLRKTIKSLRSKNMMNVLYRIRIQSQFSSTFF